MSASPACWLTVRLLVAAGCLSCLGELYAGDQAEAPAAVNRETATYRAPIDLVAINGSVFVANSKTGSVSKLDQKNLSIIGEWKVADSLAAIERMGDSLLVLDDAQGALKLLSMSPDGAGMTIGSTTATSPYPVDLAVSPDQACVAVSCLWSHRIDLLRCANEQLSKHKEVALPFAPRRLLFLTANLLVVADSFGGKLAVVDVTDGKIVGEHSVYGHNIRGLAINPKTESLMITCQTLDAGTFTSYERIFWGVVMQNGVHSLPLAQLTSAPTESASDTPIEEPEYDGSSYASRQRYPLGTPSVGSGDPGSMVVTKKDATLLLISGTNQLAFRTASHLPFERLKVGKRPEAICLNDDETQAFVVNHFDDSITMVSLTGESPAVQQTCSLGPQRELTLAEQGEQTFYDATVSLDGWFSCHSCHTDGHTNGLSADTFGDEDRGAPKKVISLLGTGDTGPWAWVGNKTELEEQIKTSLIISMQTQRKTDELPIASLAAYLRTLKPAPGTLQHPDEHEQTELDKARQTFETVGCKECHSGSALTSDQSYDVGMTDEMGESRFNPPSLRGVSQRAPYFHDGHAETLTDVLKSGHHGQEQALTDEQIRQLELLLRSL
ncbi:MAG: hypothetical protein JNM43_03955 [Planctomycetaceae bacterium]|nr:hypothetical protein [Planctomycetaceae bacterium]